MCDVDGREGFVCIFVFGDVVIVFWCIFIRLKKCLELVFVCKVFFKWRVLKWNIGFGVWVKDNCFCICRLKWYCGVCLIEG